MNSLPRHTPDGETTMGAPPAAHLRAAVVFFVLAYLVTWAVWLPRALGFEWAQEIGQIWTYGPALAAVTAALLTGGRSGLRQLGGRIVRWRIGLRWYAVIIFGPMVIALLEGAITFMFVGGPWSERWPAVLTDPLGASLILLVVLTLTDGLGEEVGWRGFALPRLLALGSAVTASLVLGLLWAAWHLPLFWTEGASLADSSVWLVFARLPATAVMYTWLFRQTRGSVLAAALFHAALNAFALPAPTAGDSLVPILTSLGLHWAIALALIAAAGAKQLDRWPAQPEPLKETDHAEA